MNNFFLILLLFCVTAVSAQPFVQIENRWQPDGKTLYRIHNQNGPPAAGATDAGWWSKDWIVEDAGSGYVRFKNRWKNTYLHVEHGPLTLSALGLPGWWSAQWKLEKVDVDHYRLKNRSRGSYLHIQNGVLEASAAQPGWWSAQWKLIGFSGSAANAAPATPATSWLYANRGTLGNKRLNQIVLPGTHDAGTYNLDGTWHRGINDAFAPDTDDKKRGLSFLGPGYDKWAKAQERTIYQQLNDGIRYIDVRVCVDKSDQLKTCHGLYGVSLATVINDAVKFSNENPNEPFILDFKKFYDWSEKTRNGKGNEAGYQGIRQSKLDELAGTLERTLGPRMAPATIKPSSTLNQLLATKRPIIVLWDKARLGTFQRTYLWDRGASMADIWMQGENRRDKLSFYVSKINALQSTDKFIEFQAQVTPSHELYKRSYDFTGSYPFGLESLASKTNPVILSYFANEWKHVRHNIINVDFYNQTSIVALTKQLNGVPTAAPTGVSKADRDRSDWGKWKLGVGDIFAPASNEEWKVVIDACHSDLDNEGTGNRITVQFWAGTQHIASKYIDGPGSQCGPFLADTGFAAKTSLEVTHVIVTTNGSDGYYIDQLDIYHKGDKVKQHGGDNGRGWCLSTDPADGNSNSKWANFVANGCRSQQQFNVK